MGGELWRKRCGRLSLIIPLRHVLLTAHRAFRSGHRMRCPCNSQPSCQIKMTIPFWQMRKRRLRTIKWLAKVLQQSLAKLEFELWLKTHVLSPNPKLQSFQGMHAKLFSHVQLSETPWTVAPRLLRPGVLQVRILQWVAITSSKGPSPPRGQTCVPYVSCTGSWVLYPSRHLSFC